MSDDVQQTQPTETQQAPDWRSSIPEDIRAHPSLSSIQDIGALAKSYVHAQSMVGADKVIVPKEDSGDEAWEQVYNKLGRPESPDKYQIRPPVSMPDGMPYDANMEDAFKQVAHRVGLNSRQLQSLYDWYMEESGKTWTDHVQGLEQQYRTSEEQFKKEFGKDYTRALEMGKRVVREMGSPELQELLSNGLGDHPAFVRFAVKVGQAMGEDRFLSPGTGALRTPAAALEEINKIRGDSAHPYFVREHPLHMEAVKKMQDLYEQAYPTQTTG